MKKIIALLVAMLAFASVSWGAVLTPAEKKESATRAEAMYTVMDSFFRTNPVYQKKYSGKSGKEFAEKVAYYSMVYHLSRQNFAELVGMMKKESSFRYDARCGTSTARGAVQIIARYHPELQKVGFKPILKKHKGRCKAGKKCTNFSHYSSVSYPGLVKNRDSSAKAAVYYYASLIKKHRDGTHLIWHTVGSPKSKANMDKFEKDFVQKAKWVQTVKECQEEVMSLLK